MQSWEIDEWYADMIEQQLLDVGWPAIWIIQVNREQW